MRPPSKKEFIRKIKRVIRNHLGANYKVFLFGSRATGQGTARSDFDVGIEGKKPVPRWMISLIKEELEGLPILYSVDIVDFMAASSKFRRIAKEKILRL
ncbi:MAG: DNA polymerase beta domain protein region [Candidatus Magasanikbacteria bacterium]|nr:DNA polymerase beta domain protein region [Candidatus Magasanikbacteria bacterium]